MSYTVMNGSDSDPDSLRDCLSKPDVTNISFDPSVTLITLTSGELVIDKSVTITGVGMGGIEITRVGPTNFRIFHIINNATVIMTGLTISNGNIISGSGSGILIETNVNLALDHCVVSGNVSNNGQGGGIMLSPGSSLTVSYCLITSNIAQNGGGLYSNSPFPFTIRNSLISNNSAFNIGGGGIFVNSAGYIYNSTFTGNAATGSGTGSGFGGALFIRSNLTMINITISNNYSGGIAGGIYRNSGTCSVGNTIVANNTGSPIYYDVFGIFNSLGYNLIGNSDGSSRFGAPGDLLDIDPMLGTLGFYGGPTQTIPLLAESPALGAGNYSLLPIEDNQWDQRGSPFYRRSNDQIDIGAFQDQSFICYHGKSKILVRDSSTNVVSEINAEDVFSEKHEVYDVLKQCFVPVKFNIITRKTTRFILIKAHSINENVPFEDFYITSGHKILINGEKIKAKYVKGAMRIKVNPPEKLYSICTLKATAILVNGMSVLTWGHDNWLRYATTKGIGWQNNKQ